MMNAKMNGVLTLALLVVSLWSCRPETSQEPIGKTRSIEVKAMMSRGEGDLRVELAQEREGDPELVARWRRDDQIQTIFVQEGRQVLGGKVSIVVSTEDPSVCTFTVDYPAEIEPNKSYDLYALSGAEVTVQEGRVLVDVSPRRGISLSEMQIPVWAVVRGVTSDRGKVDMSFAHMGCYELIHVRNVSVQKDALLMTDAGMKGIEGSDKWYYDIEERGGAQLRPYFSLLDGSIVHTSASVSGTQRSETRSSTKQYTAGTAAYGTDTPSTFVTWYVPNAEKTVPDCRLHVAGYDTGNVRVSSGRSLKPGMAYHLYTIWGGKGTDGSVDFKLCEPELLASNPDDIACVEVTVTEFYGVWLNAKEDDRAGVWIDWNNNGLREADESVTQFYTWGEYPLLMVKMERDAEPMTFKVYGKLTYLHLAGGVTTCRIHKATAKSLKSLNLYWLSFSLFHNVIKEFNLEEMKELEELYCTSGYPENLDLSIFPKLKVLRGYRQGRERELIDISKHPLLEVLEMKDIDISNRPNYFAHLSNLRELDIAGNIPKLDVTCFPKLESLAVWGHDQVKLTNIDVSSCPKLSKLHIGGHQIKKLDVSKNPELESLDCYNTGLEELDLSQNTKLKYLYCGRNKIKTLDLSANPKLEWLGCEHLPLSADMDLRGLKELKVYDCSQSNQHRIDLSQCHKLVDVRLNDNPLTLVTWGELSNLRSVNASFTLLPAEAIQDLYRRLPDVRNEKPRGWVSDWLRISLKGVAAANGLDHSVATNKGWSVILE